MAWTADGSSVALDFISTSGVPFSSLMCMCCMAAVWEYIFWHDQNLYQIFLSVIRYHPRSQRWETRDYRHGSWQRASRKWYATPWKYFIRISRILYWISPSPIQVPNHWMNDPIPLTLYPNLCMLMQLQKNIWYVAAVGEYIFWHDQNLY